MTIPQSFQDWVQHKQASFPSLEGISIVVMGDDGDLSPPFLGIMEAGSAKHETEGYVFHDVSDYQMTAELHTVPASEDEEGTPSDIAREMRRDFYTILNDADMLDYIDGLNGWQVFDIRTAAPTSDASDGRLISRWNITAIARPA